MSLEKREKGLIVVMALIGSVFLIFMMAKFGGDGPRDNNLKRAVDMEKKFFKDLEDYYQISAAVNAVDKKIEQTPREFDLFGALGEIEKELDVQSKIRDKTKSTASGTDYYSESYVTMNVKDITLESLVGLLEKIEAIEKNKAFVRVSQLSVKRGYKPDERTVDVTFRVTMYGPPGEVIE